MLKKSSSPAALRADIEAAEAFFILSKGWWRGVTRRQAWFWSLLLGGLVIANVGVNILVNRWHGWFFDAIEKKDAASATTAMAAFPLLVLLAAGVGVLILKSRETLQVYWRQWLSGRLMDQWIGARGFQRLGPAGLEPANPEYRIADDVRWATEPLVDFAIGLLSAVITVITFIGVLWSIGGGLKLGEGAGAVTIPAYLVLAAIAYGVTVSALMLFFGRRLPALYGERNAAEARFRFGLMRLRDSADTIAIGGGAMAERGALRGAYASVAQRWIAVIAERAKLTWITNGSGALVPVVPLLLAAPKYLSGEMSLGGVMQVAAAFVQVQIAFNWIVENYMRIAEWLASARRVNDLAAAMDALDDLPPEAEGGPARVAGAAGELAIRGLVLEDREGRPLAPAFSLVIRAGQAAHLGGLPREAGAAAIRAIADQWRWGSGEIAAAPGAVIFAATRRMRYAETRLRDLMANGPAKADDDALRAALGRVGLAKLEGRLDEAANWDTALTEADRQRLGFARLHAVRPDIALIDDALDALPAHDAASLFADLRAALPDSMIVTVGATAVYEASADLHLALPTAGPHPGPAPTRRRAAQKLPA
jgi:putative ATP-binding cassette transporter